MNTSHKGIVTTVYCVYLHVFLLDAVPCLCTHEQKKTY